MRLSLVALAVFLVCASCSGDDGEAGSGGSCDLVASDGYCVEYTGSGIDFKEGSEICAYDGGKHGSAPCATNDLIGKCTRHEGTDNERVWFFYSNHYTLATAEGHCMNLGGAWSPGGSSGTGEDISAEDTTEDTGSTAPEDTTTNPPETQEPETTGNGCPKDFPDKHDDVCWSENHPMFQDWSSAEKFCAASNGRLPTVDELRTLIKDCPSTETGGTCGVTDSCLDKDACWDATCEGCEKDTSGKYSVFGDTSASCPGWATSSDATAGASIGNKWNIDFRDGSIKLRTKALCVSARCLQ